MDNWEEELNKIQRKPSFFSEDVEVVPLESVLLIVNSYLLNQDKETEKSLDVLFNKHQFDLQSQKEEFKKMVESEVKPDSEDEFILGRNHGLRRIIYLLDHKADINKKIEETI